MNTTADTVIFIRDARTAEVCAVRRSGSLLLGHLQDELAVSSVLECDDRGNVTSRAVTLTEATAALHTGRMYIATRGVRRDPPQPPSAPSTSTAAGNGRFRIIQPSAAVTVKPTVTFHNNVTVTEFTLPSPAGPHVIADDSYMAGPSVCEALSFSSAVLDAGTPRTQVPSLSPAPRPPATVNIQLPPRIHYEFEGQQHSASWGDVQAIMNRDFAAEVAALGVEVCMQRNLAAIDSADAFLRRNQLEREVPMQVAAA
jgi:hypothetical protein